MPMISIKSLVLGGTLGALGALTSGTAGAESFAASAMPKPGVYLNSDGSPLLPLLKNAHTSLDIEIYTLDDATVRTLIRDALARGVKVRILKDGNPLGDKCSLFGDTAESTDASHTKASADCLDQQKLVSDVRNAGGIYEPFNKAELCPNGGGKSGSGCYEHGKIALADGIALMSTGNFDNTNLCIDGATRCDRDYTLIEDDATIYGTLEDIFEADLRATKYDVDSLIPAALQGKLTVSPDSLAPIVAFIQSATQTLDIETQYLEEPQVNAAIEAAARQGVKVTVTVASACAFGKPSASEQNKFNSTYGTFASAGISASFFNASNRINGKEGYLHAKVIVVDGNRAWLGSENGSTESLTENREYGLIFDQADWVQTVQDQIRADHESSDSETLDETLACAKDSGKGSVSEDYPGDNEKSGVPPKLPPKPKKPAKPRKATA